MATIDHSHQPLAISHSNAGGLCRLTSRRPYRRADVRRRDLRRWSSGLHRWSSCLRRWRSCLRRWSCVAPTAAVAPAVAASTDAVPPAAPLAAAAAAAAVTAAAETAEWAATRVPAVDRWLLVVRTSA